MARAPTTVASAIANSGYFPSLAMATTDQSLNSQQEQTQPDQLSVVKETTSSDASSIVPQQTAFHPPFGTPTERDAYANTAHQQQQLQYLSSDEQNSAKQQQLASLYYRAASIAACQQQQQQQQFMTSSLTSQATSSQSEEGHAFVQVPPTYSSWSISIFYLHFTHFNS